MSKRSISTPRSKVRQALRQLSLRSRERADALKRDKYTCVRCGKKQSKAIGKELHVEVHHKKGIGNWEKVIDAVFEYILCKSEDWETLCKDCHDKETQDAHIST